MPTNPIFRQSFDAAALVIEHPPRWTNDNKRAVWDIAGGGSPFEGRMDFARWPALTLPDIVPPSGTFGIIGSAFTYPPAPDGLTVVWHMNFADEHLFGAYGGALAAQDELQVAEHPALGSLKEALSAAGEHGWTMDKSGAPTPVTVTDVQRRCVIHTEPGPGRPDGLYGNHFAAASRAQVRAATERLDPPSLSNILAIAAPNGGYGAYDAGTITGILVTAFSGFASARLESQRLKGAGARTVLHTGFWGCGAFGGNRELMTILQALAADLAGMEMSFHSMDDAGVRTAQQAYQRYQKLRATTDRPEQIVSELAAIGFRWGESNGT